MCGSVLLEHITSYLCIATRQHKMKLSLQFVTILSVLALGPCYGFCLFFDLVAERVLPIPCPLLSPAPLQQCL